MDWTALSSSPGLPLDIAVEQGAVFIRFNNINTVMSAAIASSYKPSVYWDRSAHVVRDWSTDQPLPGYEGMCMVYLDLKGPVFLRTFLQNGQRCWEAGE